MTAWLVPSHDYDATLSELTRYDELLDGLYGSTGRAEAEQLLRRHVYDAISAACPRLGDECTRQLKERSWLPPGR